MNIVILNLCLLLSASKGTVREKDSAYIQISSVELLMNTGYRINCDRFEREFADLLQVTHIRHRDSIHAFRKFTDKAKFTQEVKGFDARRKFLLFENEKVVATICSDGHTLQLNGRSLKPDKKFMVFLESMIKAHESNGK